MKDNESIKCSVHCCKHCDCDNDYCSLKEIKICNCSDDQDKTATMCDSFDLKK